MRLGLEIRLGDGFHEVPLPVGVFGPTVYHYTGAGGLIGMLQSRSIWASSPLALNDLSEFDFGIRRIQQCWEERKAAKPPIPTLHASIVDSLVESKAFDELKRGIYVFSASEDRDSLSQWRGYAGPRGYAVGLDTTVRLSMLEPEVDPGDPSWRGVTTGVMSQWYRVLYTDAEQEKAIIALLDFTLKVISLQVASMIDEKDVDSLSRVVSSFPAWLATLAAQIKHPAFSSEREVRYIASRVPHFPESFRAGAAGIVPYVALVAAASGRDVTPRSTSNELPLLPIARLICGPADDRERPHVLAAAQRLLVAHGFNLSPNPSSAPYRY